jgi:outer membrane receptor protein involved in Fe transport
VVLHRAGRPSEGRPERGRSRPRDRGSAGRGQAAVQGSVLQRRGSLHRLSDQRPVWTWKAGLSWEVSDEFKLRGAQSRDIRAPTLYELYQPETVTVAGKSDRLLGLTGHVQPEVTKGNPDLTPEQASTTTFGFVYQPAWLRRFSLSVDAFHIIINNAIVEIDGAHTPPQEQCIASHGTSPLCALQVRALGSYTSTDPRNTVLEFFDLFFNADRTETYGVDFEANYATELFSHPLNLRGLVTWQPHATVADPGTAPVESAGFAFAASTIDSQSALPRLRGQFIANYQLDKLAITARMRFRSHLSNANIAGDVYSPPLWLPGKQFYDLNLDYKFGELAWGLDTEAYLNVQDVFNSQPGLAGRNTASGIGEQGGFVPGDDVLGRVWTVGFRIRH